VAKINVGWLKRVMASAGRTLQRHGQYNFRNSHLPGSKEKKAYGKQYNGSMSVMKAWRRKANGVMA